MLKWVIPAIVVWLVFGNGSNVDSLARKLNDNQGIISFVALILIVPFALYSDKILLYKRKRNYEVELKQILLHELWININHVANIEASYRNNLLDDEGIHIPHYPPRTSIIEKFIDFEIVTSLNKFNMLAVVEIFGQLDGLKHEYYIWRELLTTTPLKADKELYTITSSTMLSYIEPVMRNMMELWIVIVKDFGGKTEIPCIKNLNQIIFSLIRQGKWLRASYKSSDVVEKVDLPCFDVLLCWENDWKECPKEVIELKDIICITSLHVWQ